MTDDQLRVKLGQVLAHRDRILAEHDPQNNGTASIKPSEVRLLLELQKQAGRIKDELRTRANGPQE